MADGKNNLKEWLVGTPEKPGLLSTRSNGYGGVSGLSVEKLADKIGMQKATIYYFLLDTNRPSPETLAKICRALGVSLQEGLKYVDPRDTGAPVRLNHPKAVARRKRRSRPTTDLNADITL